MFFDEKICILIKIPMKFDKWSNWHYVSIGSGNGWRRKGNRPLPETMMIQFADAYMHMCHLASICQTAEIIAH